MIQAFKLCSRAFDDEPTSKHFLIYNKLGNIDGILIYLTQVFV